MKLRALLPILLLPVLLSGCVTGRKQIKLYPPETAISIPTKTAVVYINKITDHRVFQDETSSPSEPSSKQSADSLTKAIKDTLVGRQRNGYGMAMGDVAVSNTTVPGLTKDLLTKGFQSVGYTVTEDKGAATILVDCDIQQFWSWIDMGFWQVAIESNIKVDLKLRAKTNTKVIAFKVQGAGRDSTSFAITHNMFVTSYNKTLRFITS
jgi:uncharacterized lipoprotein YajG